MKTKTILIIILSIIVFTKCGKEPSADTHIKLLSHTECKTFDKLNTEEVPDNKSCIYYTYDSTTHTLHIQHINAGFNCCVDSLYCLVSVESNKILVEEVEVNPHCFCNCLYDLNIDITGIHSQAYQIEFVEPYRGEQTKLLLNLDLTLKSTGNYCVNRTLYPWNSSH